MDQVFGPNDWDEDNVVELLNDLFKYKPKSFDFNGTDPYGDNTYQPKATAMNFNPMMAMAGKITIAEVEELVPAGSLDPNFIHTPGIFVQRIFKGEVFEKRIEQRTVRKRD